MNPVLSVKDLRKVYSGKVQHVAVDGISFDLQEGEILGFLGPNGSGKTTSIQMLLGTLSYTSGSIRYFGKNFPEHRSEVLKYVTYASTYTSLPWSLTIEENLSVIGRLYSLSPTESRSRFLPLLERFGILDKLKARVSALSAGQVTRLMLVKAFFIQPKVVLLDEPTASLDPDISREICEFILEQREKTGVSILFTSHKMEEATALCDRAIFLKKGKIIANDLPKNLAKSISSHLLILIVKDGLDRIIELLNERRLPYKVDHHTLEIHIDEIQIPLFLNTLGREEVSYSGIRIEEPSLDEYFLQIARGKK